ncbi:MAG: hypothetical protein ACOY0R_04815, partial [Chloroflexota bacterium]
GNLPLLGQYGPAILLILLGLWVLGSGLFRSWRGKPGGLFYYFENIGSYSDWFMWFLIPGFVGVGSILAGLLGDNTRRNLRSGLNSIVISAVLVLVFSSLFGNLPLLGQYGPAILLILLGLWVLGSGLFRSWRGKPGDGGLNE